MRQITSSNKKHCKQDGFTIIQIIAAIAIIGILSTAAVVNIGGSLGSAKLSNAKSFVSNTLPNIITQCYAAKSFDLVNCNKAEIVRVGRLKTVHQNTEWGDAWTVTTATDTFNLAYPLTNSGDANNYGSNLVTTINNSGVSATASYNTSTSTVNIIYSYQ